jgi:hypothetical protein
MASIFTPTNWPNVFGPYAIDVNDCIGDSVGIINANTNYLASYTAAVSSTASTQINTLSSLIYTPPAGGILEYLSNPCDGSIIVGRSGSYTWPNVTVAQNIELVTYINVAGSSISYVPPAGATKVTYIFQYAHTFFNADALLHYNFFIDSNEVQYARYNTRAIDYFENRATFQWSIGIGGTPNNNTGRLASWTTPKILKLMSRAYSTSKKGKLHTTSTWNGAGTDMFSMPVLTIIATT